MEGTARNSIVTMPSSVLEPVCPHGRCNLAGEADTECTIVRRRNTTYETVMELEDQTGVCVCKRVRKRWGCLWQRSTSLEKETTYKETDRK